MPVMDGFHLKSYLNADVRLRKIPVIMCTALNDNESVIKGIKLGMAGYITKPINPKTLLTKVKSVAQTHQTSVLIVSDQQLPRELLAKTISRGGYSTIMAGSGAEALRLLGDNRIGVIVAEVMMSPMSGLELLAIAKDRYPHTPLVLMADKEGPQEKKDLLNAGADGYRAIPLNNTEIMELIKPLLN
jgi:CheY-like chemotaxis protein